MTDKLQKAADRGHRAKNILEDEIFAEAREHIESELIRLFSEVKPDDTEALKFIKGIHYLHGKYIAFLKSAVQDGKMAQIEVERRKKSLRERVLG